MAVKIYCAYCSLELTDLHLERCTYCGMFIDEEGLQALKQVAVGQSPSADETLGSRLSFAQPSSAAHRQAADDSNQRNQRPIPGGEDSTENRGMQAEHMGCSPDPVTAMAVGLPGSWNAQHPGDPAVWNRFFLHSGIGLLIWSLVILPLGTLGWFPWSWLPAGLGALLCFGAMVGPRWWWAMLSSVACVGVMVLALWLHSAW